MPFADISSLDKKLAISKVEKGSNVHHVHPHTDTVGLALAWILAPKLQMPNLAMLHYPLVHELSGL